MLLRKVRRNFKSLQRSGLQSLHIQHHYFVAVGYLIDTYLNCQHEIDTGVVPYKKTRKDFLKTEQ
jgi:hypothetical protein